MADQLKGKRIAFLAANGFETLKVDRTVVEANASESDGLVPPS